MWMKSSTTLKSVSVPGYTFLFNNRPKRRGGGVGLFIHKDYRASLVVKSKWDNDKKNVQLEFLLASVSINLKQILVLVYYRPPDANIDKSIQTLTDLVNDHCSDYSDVIIMGDLNIDSLKNDPKFKVLDYNLSCLNLTHMPFNYSRLNTKTNHSTLIDHIFISKSLSVNNLGTSAVSFSDHDLLCFSLDIPKVKAAPEFHSFRNYSNIKNDELSSELNQINWYYILDCPDLDERVMRLNEILCHLQDKYAPVKTVKISDPNTPWLNSYILKLQKEREIAYTLWRNRRIRRKGDALWISYTKARNKVNKAIEEVKGTRFRKRFDNKLPTRTLYTNLRNEGVVKDKNEINSHTPNLNDLNSHYANVANSVPYSTNPVNMRHPNIPCDYQFHFRCV
jgi:exonuclease III